MHNDDEYRRQAAEAQNWADRTNSPLDKAAWLRIAQSWLALIRKPRQTESDQFDAAEKAQGTKQERSNGEH